MDNQENKQGALVPRYLQSNAPQETEKEQDLSFMDYVSDFGAGIVGGALDAGEGLLQTPMAIKDFITGEEVERERILPDIETKTALGDITNTVTQGALGLVGAGKFLKALELGSKGAKLASTSKALHSLNNATTAKGIIGSGAVKGFIGDFTVFDENEERLSEAIESIPALSNPVTEYLADREDDSKAEARFKNALEGIGLGALIDSVFVMAKASKSYLKAKGKNLYGKAYNEELEKTLKDIAESRAVEETDTVIKEEAKEIGGLPVKQEENLESFSEKVFTESENIKATDYDSYHKLLTSDKRNKKLLKDIDTLAERLTVDISKVAGDDVDDIVTAFSKLTKDNPAFTKVGSNNEYLHKTLMDKVKTKLATNMSWKETVLQADSLFNQDLMDKSLRAYLKADSEALNTLAPRLLSYRLDTVSKLNQVVKLTEKSLQGGLLNNKELIEAYSDLTETIGYTSSIISGVGRALNSLKINLNKQELEKVINALETKPPALTGKNMKPDKVNKEDLLKGTELAEFVGKDIDINKNTLKAFETLTQMGMDITDINNQKLLLGMARGYEDNLIKMLNKKNISNKQYAYESFISYFTNNLLSSPVTQVFNVIGGIVKGAFTPMERIMGGMVTANGKAVMEGVRLLIGYRVAFMDSLKAARLALKMGESLIDNSKNYSAVNSKSIAESLKWQYAGNAENMSQIDAYRNIRPEMETVFKGLGYIGSFLQTPLRLMGATDEFFKQMAYRSKVYADSYEKAMVSNIADKEAFIRSELTRAFDKGGAVNEKALYYAKKQTWTQELDGESVLGRTALAIKSIPLLRPFVPFVTTPTNLIKDILEHTPLMNKAFYKAIEKEYKSGEQALIELEGKAAMGLALGFTGIYLASEGLITGAYPSSKAERALWEAQNRLPYSVRIGDKWVPYNRLDPFGAFFGMASTLYDKGMREGGDDLTNPLTYLGVVIQNISNKTYFQGLVDVIEAIQNPEGYTLKATATNLLSGLVPLSSALRFASRQLDGEMKQSNGDIGLRLQSNIPFMSENVPAKINFITGKPVEPSYIYSNAKDNFVLEQLMPYAENVRGGAPAKKIKGVDLTAEEISQLSELQGTIKLNGKTLMEALTDLTKSYMWQRAEGRFNNKDESIRGELVENIVKKYKKQAERMFIRGTPALKEREQQARTAERNRQEYMQERFAREVNISDL